MKPLVMIREVCQSDFLARIAGCSYLFVPELYQASLIEDNLVALVLAVFEKLWQCKPLPRHLVPVIGIHELIIVDTIRSVSLYFLNGWLAAVQVDDVVDERLAGWGKLDRLGGVWSIIFRGSCLARFILLAGSVGIESASSNWVGHDAR